MSLVVMHLPPLNEEKQNLVNLTLERFGMDGVALGMDYKPSGRLSLYPLVLDHTRAFVKIQDGCLFSVGGP